LSAARIISMNMICTNMINSSNKVKVFYLKIFFNQSNDLKN